MAGRKSLRRRDVPRAKIGGLLDCIILAVLLTAGCSDGGLNLAPEGGETSPTQPSSEVSVALRGSWRHTSSGCQQYLVFEENGDFTLSARITLGALHRWETVGGTYEVEQGLAAQGNVLQITGTDGVNPAAPVYCDQWRQRGETLLDFAGIAQDAGIDLASLVTRTEVSATLGKVTVASDQSRIDRFAVWRSSEGEVFGVAMTDGFLAPPLYGAHYGDPNRWLLTFEAVEVVNLPQSRLAGEFSGFGENQELLRKILNISSASDLTISPIEGSELPACSLLIFADTEFVAPIFTLVFDSQNPSKGLALNPNDPAQTFLRVPVGAPGQQTTAFLLPVTVQAPQSGSCSFSLNAKPMVVSALERRFEEGAPEIFSVVLPGPFAQRVEASPFKPGQMVLESFSPRLVKSAAKMHPQVVSLLRLETNANGVRPFFDVLDLLQVESEGARPSLSSDGDGTFLTLFDPRGEGSGLGPFRPQVRPQPVAILSAPEILASEFEAEGARHSYQIEVAAPARLVIWTEGGVKTRGELFDPHGLPLAENRAGGAAGAGFQLIKTLPAGEYDLTVSTLSGPGAYTLRLEEAAGSVPFTDDALAACVIEAGWASNETVEELDCFDRGVESLAGLETLGTVTRLGFGGNRISDLSELQNLSNLRELALDGNLVADVTALAGLDSLRRLSLAGNPLDPAQLPILTMIAQGLSHLDLSGVTTITMAQAEELHQAVPNLVLILPDGSVME